ncbi:siderochrome-iron transporter [Ophiostoma piceae UAMH 11346]|uniref:Siderochrome-iron transporter n=1 Tax=Ophiostoma piceae (strain UAMH 11346) TaxID=1262450 RepID=S3BYM2_OPHP1|nr:siderochrome-iron transporter [Ophiostoma piceae UAMH 11346]
MPPFDTESRPEPAAVAPAETTASMISNTAANDATKAKAGNGITAAAADPDPDTLSLQKGVVAEAELGDYGAQQIEIIQKVWGKYGRISLYTAMGLAMIIYELDATTFSTYFVYALSEFNKVSTSSALSVAANLSFSLTKPIWAKLSDIFGRGPMYPAATLFVILGYILASTGQNIGAFAVGTVFRCIGLTGINSLNTIIIADTTTSRQRGFGVNFQFFPYLVLPWVAAEIISSVVSPGGIGWRWGVGIIGILFPVVMVPLIVVMLVFGRRAKKLQDSINGVSDTSVSPEAAAQAGASDKRKVTVLSIASNIDFGGLCIMIVSLAFILIPLSLASLQTNGYKTPWVIVLMVIGGLGLLIAFPLYEQRIATHPVFPLRYVKHRSICIAFLLYFTDYMAAAASHGYLYNWAIIAKGMTIVQATNLSYINGVFTFLVGMLFGLIMWKTRSFKWWLMFGCVIRIIGYGVMFRIRSSDTTLGELFVVQILQGFGDGIVQTGGYIAATINAPHRETAQIVALIVTIGMLGQSIGSAISGAIYTGTFPGQLRKYLGDMATPELINDVVNSITSNIPAWGTPERMAISTALPQYNHVTAYFFIAAIVIIAPGFLLVYFLPNQALNDQQNLLEDKGMLASQELDSELQPCKPVPLASS